MPVRTSACLSFPTVLRLSVPFCAFLSILSAWQFVATRTSVGTAARDHPSFNDRVHESESVPRQEVRSNVTAQDPWQPTDDTPYEVCFVTSVYGNHPQFSDRPPDVTAQRNDNPTFRFFAFTNMPDLDAPGWTILLTGNRTGGYRRHITKSRWPKFMGWTDPNVIRCQAVFYMDGFCGPKSKHAERYKRLAHDIRTSAFGIAQNRHEKGGNAIDELHRIVDRNKDVVDNVRASEQWLLAQPDFNPNCTLYANHYIGYDPKSKYWQNATTFFWNRYSQELDSWRDQPLWCYVLDRYHIEPMRLGTFQALFRDYWKRMSKKGHHYDQAADNA